MLPTPSNQASGLHNLFLCLSCAFILTSFKNLQRHNVERVVLAIRGRIKMLKDSIQALDPSIFRTYDIRGIVDKTLNEGDVFLIGKAIASLVREQGEDQVAIARDGRYSSPRLAKVLCDGILSAGCDVIDLGMVPTPLLYYATHVLEQHSGIMLTG